MNNFRSFHGYRIDIGQKVLWWEEKPCELPVKAVELLSVLVESEGRIVTREELLDRVWPDSFVEENILSQNVYLLRKTFREHGVEEELIQTIPRRGYRFAGDISDGDGEETVIELETIDRKMIGASGLSKDEIAELIRHVTSETQKENPAAADSVPQEGSQNAGKSGRLLSPARLAAGMLIAALAGFVFFVFLYPKYQREQAAAAPPVQFRDLKYDRLSESARVISVGLSPDDQHAAYAVHTSDNRYKLVLHHLPTGSETVVVEPQERYIYCIRFSPDGNYIYYAGGHHEKPLTVFRIPLYGGISEPVLEGLTHMFSISPDGEWLSFFRREPEEGAHYLEIARASDGGGRRTVTVRNGPDTFQLWGSSAEFSPDGKKMVAGASTRAPDKKDRPVETYLVEIDVADGTQKRISRTPWLSYHEPYWSKDARGIYTKFRAQEGEPVQIGYVDPETGTGYPITNDSNDYREFRPSSDGTFLITVVWSKSENLFLVPAEGGTDARQLTFDTSGRNGADGLAWTPDGKNLIYTRTNGFNTTNIWMMDVGTRQTRQITNDERAAHKIIDVTPDGRSIVYTSNRSGQYHVWRTELDGSGSEQLTEGETDAELAELSADGRWVFFARGGLWKKPLDGGEPVLVNKTTARLARFSPAEPLKFHAFIYDGSDGKRTPWKYVVIDRANAGRSTQLKAAADRFYDWLPDGRHILFVDDGETFSNVWKIAPKTGRTERITDFQDQKIANVSLSPDGGTIAVSRGQARGNMVRINGLGNP